MIALTGATGLLGSHILEQGKGRVVRALVRGVPDRSYLARNPSGIETRAVDLVSAQAAELQSALAGAETVIHSAAFASFQSHDREAMLEANFRATQRLFEAGLGAGVKTWVQISSVATLCGDEAPLPLTEASQGLARATAYAESKLLADQWLESRSNAMRIVVLHPCYMLGRWDRTPSSGAILFALRFKRLAGYFDCEKNFVAAEDVARGVWQAVDRPVSGHYLLGGTNVRVGDFLAKAAAALGVDPPSRRVPRDELAEFAREFCSGGPVDFTKAREGLGYQPRLRLDEMLAQAIEFFAGEKMLKPVSSRAGVKPS